MTRYDFNNMPIEDSPPPESLVDSAPAPQINDPAVLRIQLEAAKKDLENANALSMKRFQAKRLAERASEKSEQEISRLNFRIKDMDGSATRMFFCQKEEIAELQQKVVAADTKIAGLKAEAVNEQLLVGAANARAESAAKMNESLEETKRKYQAAVDTAQQRFDDKFKDQIKVHETRMASEKARHLKVLEDAKVGIEKARAADRATMQTMQTELNVLRKEKVTSKRELEQLQKQVDEKTKEAKEKADEVKQLRLAKPSTFGPAASNTRGTMYNDHRAPASFMNPSPTSRRHPSTADGNDLHDLNNGQFGTASTSSRNGHPGIGLTRPSPRPNGGTPASPFMNQPGYQPHNMPPNNGASRNVQAGNMSYSGGPVVSLNGQQVPKNNAAQGSRTSSKTSDWYRPPTHEEGARLRTVVIEATKKQKALGDNSPEVDAILAGDRNAIYIAMHARWSNYLRSVAQNKLNTSAAQRNAVSAQQMPPHGAFNENTMQTQSSPQAAAQAELSTGSMATLNSNTAPRQQAGPAQGMQPPGSPSKRKRVATLDDSVRNVAPRLTSSQTPRLLQQSLSPNSFATEGDEEISPFRSASIREYPAQGGRGFIDPKLLMKSSSTGYQPVQALSSQALATPQLQTFGPPAPPVSQRRSKTPSTATASASTPELKGTYAGPACLQCHKKWWNEWCDAGEPCENCSVNGTNCVRPACKDLAAGKCEKPAGKCNRVHEPTPYSNVAEYQAILRRGKPKGEAHEVAPRKQRIIDERGE